MLIALQNFSGERPVANSRLLGANEAQAARNVKLWNGKLRPWFKSRMEAALGTGEAYSIYRYRDDHWLHWPVDVDVARGPIAGTTQLYWTGDGAPKFGNLDVIAGDTRLATAAAVGDISIEVVDVKGFKLGHAIEIQLNAGTLLTTVANVAVITNIITLADPLPGTAIAGKRVVNLNTDYPHSHYLLGVPAPVAPPSVTVKENKGTIVSMSNAIASASNTATTLDLSVASDGRSLDFRIFAKVSGNLYGTQTKDVRISVHRDPAGDNEQVFDKIITKTIQGAVAGQRSYYTAASNFVWSTDKQGAALYVFSFSPGAGTDTYRLTIADEFVPISVAGVPEAKNYELSLTARYNDSVAITIAPSTHGLKEGDKIQFGGIMGSASLTTLNQAPVSVLSVDGDTLMLDSSAFGTHTGGGTWKQFWDQESLATRNYVFTYVATLDDKDMEGPPSPVSAQLNVGDNQPVLIGDLVDPSDATRSRPYRLIRIYRTAVGTVDEEYLFVAEVDISAGSYTDQVRGTALGEVLPSLLWDPPPADLSGIIELPNGVFAGFRENTNEVLFSEPYQPHAWPDTYKRSVHDVVVGMGAFGSSTVVATKGRPTLMTGNDPESIYEDHLEIVHPCLSKRGLVDMGYAIVYPSRTGLVMTGTGLAEVVTHNLFSTDEWLALNPLSFVASRYDDRYICFFDNGRDKCGFIIDPKSPTSSLTFIDIWARDCWSDPETGELFMVVEQAGAVGEQVVAWNEDKVGTPDLFRWRSKEFVAARPVSMTAVKVDADNYPVKVNLFMDGQLFDTMDVNNENPVRCNDELGRGRLWEVEVIGNTDVDAVYVAPNMETLTRYLDGAA